MMKPEDRQAPNRMAAAVEQVADSLAGEFITNEDLCHRLLLIQSPPRFIQFFSRRLNANPNLHYSIIIATTKWQ